MMEVMIGEAVERFVERRSKRLQRRVVTIEG